MKVPPVRVDAVRRVIAPPNTMRVSVYCTAFATTANITVAAGATVVAAALENNITLSTLNVSCGCQLSLPRALSCIALFRM